MTTLVLTIALAVVSVPGMAFGGEAGRATRLVLAGVVAVGTGCAAIATLYDDPLDPDRMPELVLFGTALAVCGGHLAARAVLEVVDGGGRVATDSLLPGGAWIGALERLAIFGSLLAGMPEGVAVVLAVKGLGRYPELRIGDETRADARAVRSAVGERFIIGTFVSVLWAAGCAYLVIANR